VGLPQGDAMTTVVAYGSIGHREYTASINFNATSCILGNDGVNKGEFASIQYAASLSILHHHVCNDCLHIWTDYVHQTIIEHAPVAADYGAGRTSARERQVVCDVQVSQSGHVFARAPDGQRVHSTGQYHSVFSCQSIGFHDRRPQRAGPSDCRACAVPGIGIQRIDGVIYGESDICLYGDGSEQRHKAGSEEDNYTH
jgi:hypothetical protein